MESVFEKPTEDKPEEEQSTFASKFQISSALTVNLCSVDFGFQTEAELIVIVVVFARNWK